jgi:hypothetical protein
MPTVVARIISPRMARATNTSRGLATPARSSIPLDIAGMFAGLSWTAKVGTCSSPCLNSPCQGVLVPAGKVLRYR